MIFVTGGVRSGKSSYAEKRAIALQQARGTALHYIATSRTYDEEMKQRVKHHQLVREQSGANWQVYEQTTKIDELFVQFKKGDVVLLDCITTLVSNELFVFSETDEPKWQNHHFQEQIAKNIKALMTSLAAHPWDVILVSNEVFNDLGTGDSDTECYKRLLGEVHQHIVSLAEEAILVECGIACWKKGEKPCLEL